MVTTLRAGHKTYENALCLMIQQSKMDNVPHINVSEFSEKCNLYANHDASSIQLSVMRHKIYAISISCSVKYFCRYQIFARKF